MPLLLSQVKMTPLLRRLTCTGFRFQFSWPQTMKPALDVRAY